MTVVEASALSVMAVAVLVFLITLAGDPSLTGIKGPEGRRVKDICDIVGGTAVLVFMLAGVVGLIDFIWQHVK